MSKTVSASEAQNNFGAVVRWAQEQQEDVIIERRGKPAVVLIPYNEYLEIQRLRHRERKRRAVEAIRAVRARVQSYNQDLDAEEAYRAAGFSEDVIQETLKKDQEIASASDESSS